MVFQYSGETKSQGMNVVQIIQMRYYVRTEQNRIEYYGIGWNRME